MIYVLIKETISKLTDEKSQNVHGGILLPLLLLGGGIYVIVKYCTKGDCDLPTIGDPERAYCFSGGGRIITPIGPYLPSGGAKTPLF